MMYRWVVENKLFLKKLLFFSIIVCFASACASFLEYPLDTRSRLHLKDSEIIISFDYNSKYNTDTELLAKCFWNAATKLDEWGGLKHSVKVNVYAMHNDLEVAVGRRGYPWLRAWAKFDEIHFQTPSSWNAYDVQDRVCEVMTHELTHVVMYQHIGEVNNWYKKKIPLWFREGMASYVAEQGNRRYTRDEINQYCSSNNITADPVIDGDQLIKNHPKLVYSAAHWAFVDLMQKHGKQRIVSLITLIGQGETFEAAWKKNFGLTACNFKQI